MPPPPRPRARHLTPAEGARLLSAWHRRGQLTQREFCRRNDVSTRTLLRWLRLGVARPPRAPALRPIFSEVVVEASTVRGLQVQLGKATVCFPSSLDNEDLQALFRALLAAQEASC
jgi:hypothetical protein